MTTLQKQLVPYTVVKKLSVPNPLKSLGYIFGDWIAILGAIYLSERFFNPFIYILAVMWIGNRQHSLAIQMHDSSHGLVSRNKTVNDWVGELLCAWPMFFRMAAYRENHILHHRYSNTERDPDFRRERFPETREEIYKMLLRDLVGLGILDQLKELKRLRKNNVALSIKVARIAFYATGALLLTALGGWKLFALYWLVPIFTWLKVVLHMRAIADHAGINGRVHPFDTRTVVPNLFDRIFLAPSSCSYHFGHHLYGTVPCYRLKELHAELMKSPEVAQNIRITHGFINLMKEFPSQNELALTKRAS